MLFHIKCLKVDEQIFIFVVKNFAEIYICKLVIKMMAKKKDVGQTTAKENVYSEEEEKSEPSVINTKVIKL